MYSKAISNLFYLTLTSTILSPFVGGATLYLYVLIPFLDARFYRFVFAKLPPSQIKIFFVFTVAMCAAAQSFSIGARIMSLAIVMMYCVMTYEKGEFYLYRYVIFNVIFGMAQFVLSYVNPAAALLIGPTHISQMIWGEYAGPTYTNFFEILFVIRVSALSRESGFFASLIAATLVLLFIDPTTKGRRKIIFFFLLIGFCISLSKMSLAVVLAIPVFMFRKQLERTGVALFFLALFAIMHPLLHTLYFESGRFKSDANVSITHRMSGFELPFEMDVSDILFGIDGTTLGEKYKYNQIIVMLQRSLTFFEVPGWGGAIIRYGIFSFLLGLGYLALRRLNGFYLAIITLLTINISPLAVTASTVVAWFIVFMDMRKAFQPSLSSVPEDQRIGMANARVASQAERAG